MNGATQRCPNPRPARTARRTRQAHMVLSLTLLVMLGGTACSLDSLLNSNKLPPSVSDPAITQTSTGARAAYVGTLTQFDRAFGSAFRGEAFVSSYSFVVETGLLSDELLRLDLSSVDRRRMPNVTDQYEKSLYFSLQKVRGQAGQAIGLLTRYLPDRPDLAGHLYAIQGYTEVFLAELYCSGIPLSTLDFDGDFTYRPGSSTAEVFTRAVALFDTALALAGDSTRVMDLARVGRARALLGLGDNAQAAAALALVADDYRYNVSYNNLAAGTGSEQNFARVVQSINWDFTVSDREGSNGLDWRASGDPRTQVTQQGATRPPGSLNSIFIYHPNKYAVDGSSPIVVASGVEARLIEAEAALRARDTATWLAKLNYLRQTESFWSQIVPSPGGPLVALEDPGPDPDGAGKDSLRVDLLFRERAFWLFLTGHRQGDLRRLIRQYGRLPNQVYPIGTYWDGSQYGFDVTVPIPTEEFVNPLYTGCISRDA